MCNFFTLTFHDLRDSTQTKLEFKFSVVALLLVWHVIKYYFSVKGNCLIYFEHGNDVTKIVKPYREFSPSALII